MKDKKDKKPEEKTTTCIGLTDIDEDNERYLKKLEEYDFLKESDMAHRKEQLFLMIQSGASDGFIDRFIDDDVKCTIADLDVIRAVSFLTGEDFLMEKVAGREMTSDELKKGIAEYLVADATKTLREFEENEAQFRENLITCNALVKSLKDDRDWVRKAEREHYEQLLANEKKLMERELTEKTNAFKKKEQELEAKIEEMTKMTKMTKMTDYQQDFSDDGTREKDPSQKGNTQSRLQSFHAWHLNRILAVMVKKHNYTPAQMESILRILRLSPRTGQFLKACDPKVRVENLLALETYIIARRRSCQYR